ncbi:MAG: uracil-DNA glycosylase [Desulfobulbaceae bacterium]|nr:uracil-DNA glycosylase [Desulfobulbaceae bacterium]
MSVENNKKTPQTNIPTPCSLSSLRPLLTSLKNTLTFHQLSDISYYQATQPLLDFIRRSKPIAPGPPQKIERKRVTSPKTSSSLPPPLSQEKRFADLKKEILSCGSCSNKHILAKPIQGIGSHTPRLMIIGDCTFAARNKDNKLIMGPGEDEMLWKMMTAIGLTRNDVYVTNCIKCPLIELKDGGKPSASSCLSHLTKEIVAIAPPLILAMGELSTQLLLKTNEPLHRLRGRFRRYCPHEGISIPVLATYHPRFLLANEEMKKITWVDLQLIQSKLKKKGKKSSH